ncbi:MAG: PAS domain S-box protein [Proteobacteria bacterium]|nr:PAS domain S-box protein [Pseudomonadota bacterium]
MQLVCMRDNTINEIPVRTVMDVDASKRELKKYMVALANSEERYKLAVEGLSIGIWDWLIPTNKLHWSSRFREIIRSSKDLEEVYSVWEDRLHPEDKARTVQMLQDHLKKRTPYDVEYRLLCDDGEYVWIHAKGQAVWDEEGNAVRMVGSIEDITWQKEAQQRLKDEASRMMAVMNTVLDGLITIDSSGTIQSFNPASVRIFGYQPEEVIGKNVKALMPEPYRSGHDGYLSHYLTTGERKVIGIGREVAAQRKDGSIFPMELGINEMNFLGQRMFVGTIRDISQRKAAEMEIQRYLASLKRSNQELDDFAYIASHDLKEPLRGLSNNANFLKEDYADKLEEDGIKRLNRMMYLCERMERLVNDLLYFSRLGRQELAIQKTDLNQVIADISFMMESTLQEAPARIVIPSPLPTITCDLPRVTEVFRNLITNAVKYNDKPEKIVEIGTVDREGEQVFYVKDNGIGIAKQFYDDVFRIFKRLNDEDDSIKGTGVGLTFVKKIIERHNGSIWIESEVGEGSTFFFTLNHAQETL